MIKRGVKIGIVIAVVLLAVLIIGLIIYINFFTKSAYHVVGVEKTTYTTADFAENSTLEFHRNGTFSVRIEHREIGVVLTGIGTYTLEDNNYNLKFLEVYGRDTNNTIINITNQNDAITCKKSGNRIKFTDQNSQIYYFG